MRTPNEVRVSDVNLRSAEFVRLQRHLIEADGDTMMALQIAKNSRASERVVEIIKTAIQAGSTTPGSDWGEQLASHRQLSDGYLASLSNMSLFDAAVGGMVQVPLNPPASAAVVTAGLVADIAGERKPRAISAASFAATPLDELEASCIAIVSDELVRNAPLLSSVLDGEMKLALALAMNQHFVANIRPADSPDPSINSAGDDADDVLADLRDAAGLIDVDQLSRLLIAVPPKIAVRLALMGDVAGATAFPNMTPQGGSIGSIRVVPTDALAADEVLVLDAHGFAGNPGEIVIDSSNQASVQFESDPDDPVSASTVLRSLWQTGRRAIRLRRRFGYQKLRARSVARITSVSWGA